MSKAQTEKPAEVGTPAISRSMHLAQEFPRSRAADSDRRRDWHLRRQETIVINDRVHWLKKRLRPLSHLREKAIVSLSGAVAPAKIDSAR